MKMAHLAISHLLRKDYIFLSFAGELTATLPSSKLLLIMTGTKGMHHHLSKKRILCVDESNDDCELLSILLTQELYQIETAHSLVSALQLIESKPFDLCLFSITLWNRMGFTLQEEIRAIDPSIPVIICSSDARDTTRQQARQAGAQAFLTKPLDYDLLLKIIAQFLDRIDSMVRVS
jgi:CheY-like chemotaxis protein